MCRHCEKLKEDRIVVHQFLEVAAIRLSEKHHFPISADELEIDIRIRPDAKFVTHLRDQDDMRRSLGHEEGRGVLTEEAQRRAFRMMEAAFKGGEERGPSPQPVGPMVAGNIKPSTGERSDVDAAGI